ncbi:hypervirulence associated TUDOR domain-containing protein [Mesorhizobium sp. A556]
MRKPASEEDPQYEIKSDKTDHVAAHKGGALTLSKSSAEQRPPRP